MEDDICMDFDFIRAEFLLDFCRQCHDNGAQKAPLYYKQKYVEQLEKLEFDGGSVNI